VTSSSEYDKRKKVVEQMAEKIKSTSRVSTEKAEKIARESMERVERRDGKR
jgi:hypothetical protein